MSFETNCKPDRNGQELSIFYISQSVDNNEIDCLTCSRFHSSDILVGSASGSTDLYTATVECPVITNENHISASIDPVFSKFLRLKSLSIGTPVILR